MVNVAVSGGTGDVGRTIVNAIAKAGNHKVFILSRTAAAATADGAPERLAVDYNNVEQIKSVLQENKIEVVIAALLLADDTVTQSQITLIRAAAQSGTVKKFIPTEYHLDYNVPVDGVEIHFAKYQLQCEEELKRQPALTYTLIRNGLFLDYMAMPFHPKPTNLKPYWMFIDLEHEVSVIPGDGTKTVVFTHTEDTAAFIERLIGLPAEQWPRESLVQSNKIQVKDLLDIVKKVSGRDFKVTWESPEAIRKGEITMLPSNKPTFEQPFFGDIFRGIEKEVLLTVLSDGYELPGKNLAEIFPDVQTTNIEEFLAEAWKLKEAKASSAS
ncbi:Oxidoreductase swnN [Cladobotryum mycophilum]|uniref:Oxidoreductase swnN n=1 Tax=Cladobotryum mycophilum TaxID=491253 RepID=A0ABR0SXA7_9HYPO